MNLNLGVDKTYISLESAYNSVKRLVNDFKANERHYLASDYSESQARVNFINIVYRLVYELYGLIEEEIKIVENN